MTTRTLWKGGEEKEKLYAMRKWAQEVSLEFREGVMNMWWAKAAAYQAPATIMPKRKRREVVANARDGEDDQEDRASGGGKSESKMNDNVRHPTRGQTTRKTTVVTPSRKAMRTGEDTPIMRVRLREIEEGQQTEENLTMDLQMQGNKPKTTAASTQEYKDWHTTLVEPYVMLMVEARAPFMQGVYSVLTYETSRRMKDQYAGKYLVVVGERLQDGSCMFVNDHVDVEVLASYKDMKPFCRGKKN
jgi:translation elongation factor EF-G